MLSLGAHISPLPSSPPHAPLLQSRPPPFPSRAPAPAASSAPRLLCFRRVRRFAGERSRRPTMAAVISPDGSGLAHDLGSAAVTAGVALALLRFFEELAKLGVFEQKLTRKLVHITVGMVFLLFWPLFSSGKYAPFLAALAPGVNIIRMLILGSGVAKNEAMVKSMSRSGDYRELLKGPLYYATTITFATSVFWRNSPIAIALICNLCAGDGIADVVGRRLGQKKLPYNPNKSYAGSIAMAVAGFLASIGYMHYFHTFGFIEETWYMALGFLAVSVAATLVESLPISSELDDNLTVPLTSFLVGSLLF
ncbi:probable phytol kinase 2, chloroplastic [Phragmites australis]|uniref:probable phytol kinase 2, chloroplastic n=1 Tax=Phragmites australis TaxID=29695 RepID=UPI002D799984|nr:probable phytol kinase 2, chloroplastic [Phragmites australis]